MGAGRGRLFWRLSTPALAAAVVALALLAAIMPTRVRDDVAAGAEAHAIHTVANFKIVRDYYNRAVVSKIRQSTDLKATHLHANDPKGAPIPATFMLDISDLLKEQGTRLSFYSPLPFANRAARTLDPFQQRAWATLSADPSARVSVREVIGDRAWIRVGVADRMGESCVSCHNAHPDSPKKDWKVGDVRAVFEVAIDVTEDEARADATIRVLMIGAFGSGGLFLIAAFLGARSVTRPLRRLTAAMADLAAGRPAYVPETERNDEVGAMARATEVFKKGMEESRTLIERVLSGARQLAEAAGQAAAAAGQVSEGAGRQLAQLESVASATQETAQAIGEVAGNTHQASSQAKAAAQLAENGVNRMSQLAGAVDRIAQNGARVAEMSSEIERIANQTNMLSLNAAIEAARAGEHGKGFAVVAEEVRRLAESSGQLAQRIAELVGQGAQESRAGVIAARDAGAEMREVAASIAATDRLNNAIAASMEEQQAAAGEVGANVQQLMRIGQQTASAAEEIAAAMEDLNRLSVQLKEEAERMARR